MKLFFRRRFYDGFLLKLWCTWVENTKSWGPRELRYSCHLRGGFPQTKPYHSRLRSVMWFYSRVDNQLWQICFPYFDYRQPEEADKFGWTSFIGNLVSNLTGRLMMCRENGSDIILRFAHQCQHSPWLNIYFNDRVFNQSMTILFQYLLLFKVTNTKVVLDSSILKR